MTKKVFDINEKVVVNGNKGQIESMLGKETKNPSELDWYQVKFENGQSEHYSEIDIKPIDENDEGEEKEL